VQALIGHIDRPAPFAGEVFLGEKSDWSGTQSIIFGEPNATALATEKPTYTQTSTDPPLTQENVALELYWKQVAIAAITIIAILGVSLAFVVTRKQKGNHRNDKM
jgi:hypothetical protein